MTKPTMIAVAFAGTLLVAVSSKPPYVSIGSKAQASECRAHCREKLACGDACSACGARCVLGHDDSEDQAHCLDKCAHTLDRCCKDLGAAPDFFGGECVEVR